MKLYAAVDFIHSLGRNNLSTNYTCLWYTIKVDSRKQNQYWNKTIKIKQEVN